MAASYYFYMGWNAGYALLILLSTVITYLSGIVLERIKQLDTAEAMKMFVSAYDNCVYLNLFEAEYAFDGTADFQDSGHLNDRGAKKVAQMIGTYLLGQQMLK